MKRGFLSIAVLCVCFVAGRAFAAKPLFDEVAESFDVLKFDGRGVEIKFKKDGARFWIAGYCGKDVLSEYGERIFSALGKTPLMLSDRRHWTIRLEAYPDESAKIPPGYKRAYLIRAIFDARSFGSGITERCVLVVYRENASDADLDALTKAFPKDSFAAAFRRGDLLLVEFPEKRIPARK
jgi:hypothetical protein